MQCWESSRQTLASKVGNTSELDSSIIRSRYLLNNTVFIIFKTVYTVGMMLFFSIYTVLGIIKADIGIKGVPRLFY